MEERSTKKMYKARDKKEQRTDMRDKREQRKIQALFCVNGQAQREICLLYLPCHYLSTNEGRGFPEGGTKLCWLHPCLDLVVSVIKRLQYHSKEQRRQEAKTGWKEKHRSTNEKKKKFRKKNSKKTKIFSLQISLQAALQYHRRPPGAGRTIHHLRLPQRETENMMIPAEHGFI